MASETDLSDHVGTTVAIDPHSLTTFHRNARRGDIDAIAESLQTNGQFKPVVVNVGTHTGRVNEVLAGNHTLQAFLRLADTQDTDPRWDTIAVHVVDVDDAEATRIVLADNRTFEVGYGYDADALAGLLSEVGTAGTGYTDADLDKLEEALSRPPAEPRAEAEDPAPDPDTPVISYQLIFDDEDQQDAWFAFVRRLKDMYPNEPTIAARVTKFLVATQGDRA